MVSRTVLVARLDNAGDVLLQGPLVRAVAASADRVVLLAGPAGAEAAGLLPGVDEVWTWACPWILGDPPPVDAADLAGLTERVRDLAPAEAVVSTSFHQSPLPPRSGSRPPTACWWATSAPTSAPRPLPAPVRCSCPRRSPAPRRSTPPAGRASPSFPT